MGKEEKVCLPLKAFKKIFEGFEDIIGSASASIVYFSGKEIGKEIEAESLEEFVNIVNSFGLGELEIESVDEEKGEFVFTLRSTIAPLYEGATVPVDNLIRGIITGFLEKSLGKKMVGDETQCVALGAKVCKIRVVRD